MAASTTVFSSEERAAERMRDYLMSFTDTPERSAVCGCPGSPSRTGTVGMAARDLEHETRQIFDRIQPPRYATYEAEQLEEMFARAGFSSWYRVSRRPKYDNIRRLIRAIRSRARPADVRRRWPQLRPPAVERGRSHRCSILQFLQTRSPCH